MSTDQLSLLLHPIDVRFWEFHHANGHVYDELLRLARRWKAAGHSRCSMDMLFHLLRWDAGMATSDVDFKLNNDFTSRYARLLSANHRDMAGFFETRSLTDEHAFDAARRWVQTRTEVAAS